MNESMFYHALAITAHGDHRVIKKYREGREESWEETYYAVQRNGISLPDPEKAFEELHRLNIHLILLAHKNYPDCLRNIPHAPFALYVRGMLKINSLALAIVGTRRASDEGLTTARTFAREIATAGFNIISGLAFGIDEMAHQGCLDAGGITVAVLAGGLDSVYPHTHRGLAEKIIERGGVLVSEYPPGERPYDYRFIERNRIISGLARGVLVIEAPESSGALATARYAIEQNRDVFVTPGNVSMNSFKGSHALIRQGAQFVSMPRDIIEEYGAPFLDKPLIIEEGDNNQEILILKALRSSLFPVDVDKLVEMTKLEPRIINRTLSFLIIRGIIRESGGGYTI